MTKKVLDSLNSNHQTMEMTTIRTLFVIKKNFFAILMTFITKKTTEVQFL